MYCNARQGNNNKMLNETINFIANPELLLGNQNNIYVTGNMVAKWVISWNNYVIGGLFLLLIIWNIWLTIKLRKRKLK